MATSHLDSPTEAHNPQTNTDCLVSVRGTDTPKTTVMEGSSGPPSGWFAPAINTSDLRIISDKNILRRVFGHVAKISHHEKTVSLSPYKPGITAPYFTLSEQHYQPPFQYFKPTFATWKLLALFCFLCLLQTGSFVCCLPLTFSAHNFISSVLSY